MRKDMTHVILVPTKAYLMNNDANIGRKINNISTSE